MGYLQRARSVAGEQLKVIDSLIAALKENLGKTLQKNTILVATDLAAPQLKTALAALITARHRPP